MPRKARPLSPLEVRKRLLIAESELNRAELSEDLETLTSGVREVARQAKAIAAWASAAALLMAGIQAWRRSASPHGAAKPSWIQKLFTAVRLVSTIWSAVRPTRENEPPDSESDQKPAPGP